MERAASSVETATTASFVADASSGRPVATPSPTPLPVAQTVLLRASPDSKKTGSDEPSFLEVSVLASVPLSSGHLPDPYDTVTPVGRARVLWRVIEAIQDVNVIMSMPSRLRGVTQSDLEWLTPVLLGCHPKPITEVLVYLAHEASPRLRLILLALHCSHLMVEPKAPHSLNSLIDYTDMEKNTLTIVDWFRDHQHQFVEGSEARNMRMVHPFTAQPVDSFVVKKVFATKAKPMLIESRDDVAGVLSPSIITKFGDDLRVDLLVMTMFRVFNVLWESCAHRFKDGQLPYIVTYQVLPLAIDKGVIEAVANAHSVADHKWSAIDKHRTVSSSIGCFIGGYMLGVRDRHEDNMLFRTDTMELLHIDFGYIFNEQTKMFDAPRIAIPSQLKRIFQEASLWDVAFIENAVIAYQILREHRDKLTAVCAAMFSPMFPTCAEYMVKEAFLGELSDGQAEARIRYLLERGPHSWKRFAKNVAHVLGF